MAGTPSTALLPMTTFWTPAAACTSQPPFIKAGSCTASWGTTTCIPFPENIISEQWIVGTDLYWTTTNRQVVSPECRRPSVTDAAISVIYSPAIGCPIGYTTADWLSWYDDSELVYCCPQAFGEVHTDFEGNVICERTLAKTGERLQLLAWGEITNYDTNGVPTDTFYMVSSMSTTTFTPPSTATTEFGITITAIPMIVPSSWLSATPTSSGEAGNQGTESGTIGGLSRGISIVIFIAISVAFLLAVFCIIVCCCKQSKPSDSENSLNHRTSYRPFSPTPHNTRPVVAEVRNSVPLMQAPEGLQPKRIPPCCEQNMSCSCENAEKCCKCADGRKGTLEFGTRVRGYCQKCKHYWNAQPNEKLPNGWAKRECNFYCTRNQHCCSCVDDRTSPMTVDTRLQPYCPSCSSYWREKTVYPPSWNILGCPHMKRARCSKVGNCCTCRDEATPRAQRLLCVNARTEPYCGPCKLYWLKKSRAPESNLPAWWQINRSQAQKEKEVCLRQHKPIFAPPKGDGGEASRFRLRRGPRASREAYKLIEDEGPKNPGWQRTESFKIRRKAIPSLLTGGKPGAVNDKDVTGASRLFEQKGDVRGNTPPPWSRAEEERIYGEMHDHGPLQDGPQFRVQPTRPVGPLKGILKHRTKTTWPTPEQRRQIAEGQEPDVETVEDQKKGAAVLQEEESAGVRPERARRKQHRGPQYDEPQFSVPPTTG